LNDWQSLLYEGVITILDYNRLLLEIAKTKSETASEETALRALISKIDYISGGQSGLLEDAGYDILDKGNLTDLIETKKTSHPGFIIPEKEYLLAVREVGVARADNLPGLEIGFGSEIIAGEHHTGPKVGISVPVWTNRNQVKLSQARVTAAERSRDATINLLVTETESLYESCEMSAENLETLKAYMANYGDTTSLTKALYEKEITTTEFFSFMDAVYDAKGTLVKLEWENMVAKARLLDHTLISY
jgi:outer membrane protein TolC